MTARGKASRGARALSAALFAAAALCACSRAPFLYKPNAPLWAGHDAQAPLFAAKAGVEEFADLSPYEDAREPAPPAGAYGFDWTILNGDSYSDTEELSGAGAEAAAAANAALNKIFAQALKDAALVLERPDVLPKLGWAQP